MIGNEKLHYIEPHHGQPVLRGLWELGQAVQQRQVLELDYQRLKGAETVRRTVEPVGILFSEYYFYLAAYLRGVDRKQIFENPEDPYPTIYRIDRIRAFRATGEHFTPRLCQALSGGRIPQARTVHVRRQAAKDPVQIHRPVDRSGARPAPDRRNSLAERFRLDNLGGGLRQGD